MTQITLFMRSSPLLFPAVETVHLIALAVLAGTIVLVNLRALGLAVSAVPLPQLAREAAWPLKISLIAMVLSGTLLLGSDVAKYFDNSFFRVKMALLASALVFQFFIHEKALLGTRAPLGGRAAALVSLCLWLGVALAGRAIGLF